MFKIIFKKLLVAPVDQVECQIWSVFRKERITLDNLKEALTFASDDIKARVDKMTGDETLDENLWNEILADENGSDQFWEDLFLTIRDFGCNEIRRAGSLKPDEVITVTCTGEERQLRRSMIVLQLLKNEIFFPDFFIETS